ncbi:MAG: patatin-like phospholipase family protein [Cellvibrionaceae bacterium]
MMTNALILSGGGARAAYQVGVLNAVNDILPSHLNNPFPIICGTSAGAINALALATHSGDFDEAALDLNRIWKNISTEKIYKSGWYDVNRGILRLVGSLFNQGVGRKDRPLSLLDNSPLRDFLTEIIDFKNIETEIELGRLEAISVSAMGYTSGESVSFFQGKPGLEPWRRHRRVGQQTTLTVDHLLASSAIPTIFPSIKIDKQYFGDGAMRQLAPISPALHLGADAVFVIGVSGNRNPAHWGKKRIAPKHSPSMAQIIGHMFNSAFIDSLEGDIEHLERVNKLLSLIPEDVIDEGGTRLRPVKTMVISPSRELDKIAGRKVRYLPKSMRFYMGATGATARGGGSATASYLLFEKQFCDELMDLGYQDAMWEKEAIEEFFDI